jgi:hypothetical protein
LYDPVGMTAVDAVNNAFKDIGLLRATPQALATVPLSAPSKQFLLAGGLPAGSVFGFDFEPVKNLPAVSGYAARRGYPVVVGPLAAARCVGDSSGVLMVLDPRTWNVLWIDTHGEHESMFVNSNVESLGESLAAYESLGALRCVPAVLSSSFEKMLLHIDPPCVEGWWSTVIQEVEFGLS